MTQHKNNVIICIEMSIKIQLMGKLMLFFFLSSGQTKTELQKSFFVASFLWRHLIVYSLR